MFLLSPVRSRYFTNSFFSQFLNYFLVLEDNVCLAITDMWVMSEFRHRHTAKTAFNPPQYF